MGRRRGGEGERKMIDRFQELIAELGRALDLPLFVDTHQACTLEIADNIRIQMQLDPNQAHLFMACFAIEIPPGRFRENVLKEALKANFSPDPKPAVLGYTLQNNHLTLHQSIPIDILNGERLAGFFQSFLKEAQNWIRAIEQGKSAP